MSTPTSPAAASTLLASLDHLNAQQLRRLLVEHLTQQKVGLYWESSAIERDAALNANVVLPRLHPEASHCPPDTTQHHNLIIEGDNFDSLRLLRATHAGKIRVIYIDPPYNTGNKDWVYNDHYVGANDRYRHSQWLEFLYQRLTLARELLTSDGVILVSINDENRARLELLMDEVFPGRRVGSFVWRTRDTTSAKGKNFSDVHEHILVYGGEGFSFNGREKTQKKYKNPDKDPRGPWNGDPLTLAFNRFERENLYYPIFNPETERWYPCDENRVWAYATESRVEEGQSLQAETMEEFIRRKQILFPADEKVVVWQSIEEIYEAIESNDVPVTPKRKRPLISKNTPNLEFWIGKSVGFGRPLFKKFWKDLRSHSNPVSSWIARINETHDEEDLAVLRSPQAGEGTEEIQRIFGSKVFQYPKPPTLIAELIRQASLPNDIILDFFAGSGTTGQVVLELNEEDGGNRRFILCSSTEATAKEPEKNLCRDVCAERIRRVITTQGYRASFAYLQLDKIAPADVAFEFTPEQAQLLLALRETGSVPPSVGPASFHPVGLQGDWLLVVCHNTSATTLDALAQLHAQYGAARLAVFCQRPKGVPAQLQARGVPQAVAYSLVDALHKGHAASPRNTRTATPKASAAEAV